MRITPILLALALWGASCDKKDKPDNDNPDNGGSNGGGSGPVTWPAQPPLPVVEGTANFTVSAALSDTYVDVMGSALPRMPNYPQLSPKPGKIRGFVAGLDGKPVKGAYLEVRTGGVVFREDHATTDANGYYEMNVIGSVIQIAGHLISYGKDPDSKVAMSLYPTDGEIQLPNNAESAGVIKNWVLLSYGGPAKTDVAMGHPARYMGGQLTFNWEEWYVSNPQGLPSGKPVVIKITPVAGTTLYGETKEFIVTKNQTGDDLFNICNIPFGKYKVSASQEGRPLQMTNADLVARNNPNHGMFPRTTAGEAEVYFFPTGTAIDDTPAKSGYLNQVVIKLTRP